jgi:hypothetical protein
VPRTQGTFERRARGAVEMVDVAIDSIVRPGVGVRGLAPVMS